MKRIFNAVNVQPSYGSNSAIVSWEVTPGYQDALFYIYRSPTGVDESDDWIILNENNPVSIVNFFVDDKVIDDSKFRYYYYRVLAEKDGVEYDSPVIGSFHEGFTKTEYQFLYTVRALEYRRMSYNGLTAFHCIPSVEGKKSANINKVTNTQTTTCADDESFRQLYAEGFKTLVQTKVEILSISPSSVKDNEDGSTEEIQQYRLRLLGFPLPEVGHLIVLPRSDTRLVITGDILPLHFKQLPVAYEATATQLRKDDRRYQLPMPELLPDPKHPIYIDTAL